MTDIPTLPVDNIFTEINNTFTIPQSETDVAIPAPSTTYETQMLPVSNIEDALLLAHFINQTFHWQFRFCYPEESDFGQGQFIWLMSKSRPLYMASLALSNSHMNMLKTAGPSTLALAGYEEADNKHDKAAEEFKRQYDKQHSVNNVAQLACIASILSSSFFRPDKVDWDSYIKMGISQVMQWVAQQLSGGDQQTLKPPEDPAQHFFISFFIRFDILASVTREASPSLIDSYRQLLNSDSSQIALERVCGCANWVFKHLLSVYQLRDWKKRTREAGLLSLWELTSKADAIKKDLEEEMAKNFKTLEALKNEQAHNQQRSKHEICVITHAFACAVSTMLEVVVSGAYPRLPEIKQKVERTIDSFRGVEDPELLGALRWPIFIVGCVIEVEQYGMIRQLASSPPVARSAGVGGLLNLLESCWRAIESGEIRADMFDFSCLGSQGTQDILIA
ncbi:fungal-specific transcription factor domain-containing protein [Astrocystis sublimbata]|nr:fungal-specific transcription factor domain-containing protein [Astrocystis sublimbata]